MYKFAKQSYRKKKTKFIFLVQKNTLAHCAFKVLPRARTRDSLFTRFRVLYSRLP